MAKLHELIAVEGDLEGTQNRITEEAVVTFTKKPDHFQETVRTVNMFEEVNQGQNVDERKAMVTTVHQKLDHTTKAVSRYWDAVLQKESANQKANADLVVGDRTLARDVPATVLLGMETKLKTLRAMYEAIPTLAPGIPWQLDPQKGAGVYVAEKAQVSFKTAKTVRHQVLAAATEHHPAQIERWNEDVPVGRIEVRHWSGMLSPREKSDLIERIDDLIRGVKRARQRANVVDVPKVRIAKDLFDYIHGVQQAIEVVPPKTGGAPATA